ncbi:TPR domain protein, putative component of TonB system [Grimontia indica]|uniref:TPR domain protein, putative component of TonB system n=1 Tax=Grimontia indica TaxID=1056512 RepID=R1GUM2_9GAMM|nr:tetratricopeptide repeat protein [Grimontia indica]EOD79873.1 TPR domain protein, putative component of TonB system [Grimontia indica]
MKRFIQQLVSRRSVLIWLVGALFLPSSNAAELSAVTARQLQKALEFQAEEQWQQAAEALESAPKPTDYDSAFVNRMLGVVYWQRGETLKAINALYAAVNSHVLEAEAQQDSERMLADLLMTQSRYQDALKLYYPLSETPELSRKDHGEIWLRIAQAHYQDEQYSKALKGINTHLKLASDKPSSLSLKLGSQLKLKHWKGSTRTLKQLIAIEPGKKTWWIQLVGSYQRLSDKKQMLNTLVLATREGIKLFDSEKMMMAQLYQQQGVPEKAAAVMAEVNQGGEDTTRLVMEASYWQQAKEWDKAIGAWERAAADAPKYYWVAAQLSLQHGHYRKALSLLDKVDNPEKASDVELARALAYDKLDELDKALLHAKRADALKPSSQSHSWIQYLSQKTK